MPLPAPANVESATNPGRALLLSPLKTSRPFTALWCGQSLSGLGDKILFVILPLALYSITRSTLDMGLVMSLLVVPQIVLLPFTGVLVDYWPRVRLMMAADAVRFGLLCGLTVLTAMGEFKLEWLYIFALAYGSMVALFQPAYAAVRAQVFTPDIRNAANSLTQVSSQASGLIGPSIGGVIVSAASSAAGFAADAITFIISIVSLLFVRVPPPAQKAGASQAGLLAFARELLGGYRELKKHPWLWITILAFSFVNICAAGIMAVLIPWLVKIHLGYPAYDFGILTSAEGVGALVGALVLGSRRKWRLRGLLAYGGTGCQGLTLLGMAFLHSLPALIVMMVIGGAGVMAFAIIWEGSLQDLVPEEAFGRVASIDMLGSFALLPLGFIFTGWLAKEAGGITTIVAEATAMIAIVVIALFVPAIRKFD